MKTSPMLLGDFNHEPSKNTMIQFCKVYKLKISLKSSACNKNTERPPCIDLILTNRQKIFTGCHIIESVLSDFCRMTVTIIKMHLKKQEPGIMHCKMFNKEHIHQNIFTKFQKENNLIYQLKRFLAIFKTVLERNAFIKKSYVQANHNLFINKTLQREVTIFLGSATIFTK